MFEQYSSESNAESSDTEHPDWTADACGETPIASPDRFIIFAAAFLIMIPGSVILFFWLGDTRYGIQFTSIIGYSAATVLYTFSANRGMQRYLFDCPSVRSQYRRLVVRHICFLTVLVLLQTAILSIRPHLSPWWMTEGFGPRGMPPFLTLMFTLCGALCIAEIVSNRSLLQRAHPAANPGCPVSRLPSLL
jgi:hypothetical protein